MQMRCNHCGRLLTDRSDLYINDKTEDTIGCGGCLTMTHPSKKKKCPICKVFIEKKELALCKRIEVRPINTQAVRIKYEPVSCIDCYTMVQPNGYIPMSYDAFEGVEWY